MGSSHDLRQCSSSQVTLSELLGVLGLRVAGLEVGRDPSPISGQSTVQYREGDNPHKVTRQNDYGVDIKPVSLVF